MPKKPARDSRILSLLGIGLGVLLAGFVLAWLYLQHAEKKTLQIKYLTLPSVAISRDGHSISASIAVRTSAADAEWASKNKAALEQVMKKALMEVDPVAARAPNGLHNLQASLLESSNATLQSTRIQEVLVTDFLVSEGDL